MSWIVYLTCFLLVAHCLDEAVKMEKETKRMRVYSYILFFASILGVAMWTYYSGTSLSVVGLLAGITAIIFTDRRRTRKEEHVEAAYD